MTLPTCCQYHAAKLPNGCGEGRKCPERTSLLSPQERSTFDCIDRWGFPIAAAAVVVIVIALLIVLNWPHLSRWLAS